MKLDKSMQWEPKEGDYPVLKPGEYVFEVEDATHKRSSTGNLMWEMKLRFEQDNGPDVMVWDYLVEKADEWAVKKFNSFYASLGVDIDDTDKTADCIGEFGKARVKIEKGDDNNPDRNKVAWYLPKEAEKTAASQPVNSDDLPF